MANKEQFLDRNGVSHFYLLIKNKLTAYFKTLFVSKKDGYDLSQNDFTNELKTKLENMVDGGGGVSEDEIVNGYYNAEDYLFYEDAEFSIPITGESDKLYVDVDNNVIYRFSGSIFVQITSYTELTALTNTEIDEIIASVDSSTE
jgi:hypothetical protein